MVVVIVNKDKTDYHQENDKPRLEKNQIKKTTYSRYHVYLTAISIITSIKCDIFINCNIKLDRG